MAQDGRSAAQRRGDGFPRRRVERERADILDEDEVAVADRLGDFGDECGPFRPSSAGGAGGKAGDDPVSDPLAGDGPDAKAQQRECGRPLRGLDRHAVAAAEPVRDDGEGPRGRQAHGGTVPERRSLT